MRNEIPVDAGSPETEGLARRLDKPMGVLGLVFVLVVLGQSLARETWLVTVLTVAGWLCWGVFVAEFVHRAWRAPDRRRFWVRNWWQVLFLVLPFLRFARALALLRTARLGGVISAAVRGSRSAGRLLSSRIGWLAAVTGVVVLAGSQLLYVGGAYTDYAPALHQAALATVTGQPLTAEGGLGLDLAEPGLVGRTDQACRRQPSAIRSPVRGPVASSPRPAGRRRSPRSGGRSRHRCTRPRC